MASNYGLNFGFRRSDESMAIREGRLRTPATGTFRIGSLVTFDPAAVGYLKAAAANEIGYGGTVGLLVQEEQFIGSIYAQPVSTYDSFNLGLAKNNTLSVIWGGAGTKVWMKNSVAQTRLDGRSISAVTMFTPTGIAVKDYLAWDGTKYIKGTGVTDSMLRVTSIDSSAGAGAEFLEAVLVH